MASEILTNNNSSLEKTNKQMTNYDRIDIKALTHFDNKIDERQNNEHPS